MKFFILLFLIPFIQGLPIDLEFNEIEQNFTGIRSQNYWKNYLNPEETGPYLEGDIVSSSGQGRSGMLDTKKRWPKGIVPFIIDDKFSSEQLSMIEAAFKAYHDNTCIRFVKRSTERDYLRIRGASTGCWSHVGRNGGAQTVNLQRDGCLVKIGTAIHEFMHALGFWHEQTRADRDDYVTIMYSNIEKGKSHDFDKKPADETTSFGVPYDYGSVMHYTARAFSKNGEPTIVAKQYGGSAMGQRNRFGDNDIAMINAMYECQKDATEPTKKPPAAPSKKPDFVPIIPQILPIGPIPPVRPIGSKKKTPE